MSCPYQIYKEEETYFPYLYCSINNGKRCYYSKRCNIEQKYISLDNTKECYIYNMNKKTNIPKGAVEVVMTRPTSDGTYLYINVDGNNQKVKIDVENYDKDYVYYKKLANGCKVSATPFQTTKNVKKSNAKN